MKVKVYRVQTIEKTFDKRFGRAIEFGVATHYVEAKTAKGAKSNIRNLLYIDPSQILAVDEVPELS